MASAVTRLPDHQIAPHLAAYDREQAAKRRAGLVGLATLLVLILVASHVAEVEPAKFAANIHQFTSYIGRIFHLDNGQFVLTDPAEWFWGWKKWLI
ncbi:MAG: phosphonate ABC transporter, permease protein PhnE, partial [Rhabdaerophilum sp.]